MRDSGDSCLRADKNNDSGTFSEIFGLVTQEAVTISKLACDSSRIFFGKSPGAGNDYWRAGKSFSNSNTKESSELFKLISKEAVAIFKYGPNSSRIYFI